MFVGMLTAPFADKDLNYVIDFAETANITGLEVMTYPGSLHIDPTKLDIQRVRLIRDKLDNRNRKITALAYYDVNLTNPKKCSKVQEVAKCVIDSAKKLNVDIICMLSGFPSPGLSKVETIRQVLPKAFKPILAHAKKYKIRIALENWYQTNLQGLDTFEELFKNIPDENLGLNYDPSHLVHQECDYLLPVCEFKSRIFHTHAKDTLIDYTKKARVGIYGEGWWKYVLPGFGVIRWGEYISHLKHNGYDGVLSIEHEDTAQSIEEGFVKSAWHLESFC
ncbi:MAG TPA: sugar phosphate isomerase/epimerase [Candidatus Hydrogenedens sp.]|nr:sugar phosphate isomerase/epimerase [Candidatus Hydrogenedens sp.]